MNDMQVMVDPVQGSSKKKTTNKSRCDSEFENLGSQVLERKMPFYLSQCSLSARPVKVPGLFHSIYIPWALRIAGRGAQHICCFGILISFWGGGKGEIKAHGLRDCLPLPVGLCLAQSTLQEAAAALCGGGRAACAPRERTRCLASAA